MTSPNKHWPVREGLAVGDRGPCPGHTRLLAPPPLKAGEVKSKARRCWLTLSSWVALGPACLTGQGRRRCCGSHASPASPSCHFPWGSRFPAPCSGGRGPLNARESNNGFSRSSVLQGGSDTFINREERSLTMTAPRLPAASIAGRTRWPRT